MIVAGLKLTLVGMGAVGLFLIILIVLIKLSYKFLGSFSADELLEMEAGGRKRFRKGKPEEEKILTAVITAAIAAHRARRHGK